MKICPTCRSVYPSHFAICPRDAVRLVETEGWSEGAVIRGKYRILSKVGQGGMGAVYKALHMRFDEVRALKVMSQDLATNPDFLKRFEREAVLMSKVKHPNVVRVDDIDEAEDGCPFIVMEFIEGRSLRRVIQEEGPLAPLRVCSIAKQAAAGLEAAHRLGMIHRDIKPENIVLLPSGGAGRGEAAHSPSEELAKVLDFGIAKLKEARWGDGLRTMTGVIIGTPQYLSPEQALGKRSDELDGRSDLYSLGLVMYQMLTCALPFEADSAVGWMRVRVENPPTPLRTARPDLAIPEPLANLVMRCLEKERDLRPPNAGELIREIQQVEAEIQRPAALHVSSAVVTPASSPPKDSKVPIAVRGSGAPRAKIGPWAEGQIIRGKYRVLEMCGMGGFAIFYKALQLKPEMVREIEVASDEYREIFPQYARECIKLQHPSVACAVEADEAEDGRPYLVTEWVEGLSLDRVMKQEGPLAPLRACAIARQVAAGLGAAHALGVIHGEVYPLYVTILPDPAGEKVKLVGFRTSYLRAAIEAKFPKDTKPCPSPPPAYASPEQLEGKPLSEVDGRSNLFSLGVILYEMLTGQKPFPGENPTAIAVAIFTQQPKPVRMVRPDLVIPDTLANLVMRCLEKDRNLRPANAGEVIREIERAEQEIQRSAKPDAPIAVMGPTSDPALPYGGIAVLKRQATDNVVSELWAEGNVIRGKYRLLAKLFADGHCDVFKALQLQPGLFRTLVVARSFDFTVGELAEYGEVFKQDALDWMKLQHPNVARVEDVDEDDEYGRPFIVMESIPGGILAPIIEQEAPFKPLRACAIAKQIASGLEAVHAQGGIYGEVAPRNLLVFPGAEGEQIKLLPLRRQKLDEALNDIYGEERFTLDFRCVSPEQIKGVCGDKLDGRSDLYSLGVLMYQMLIGVLPFRGKDTVETIKAVLLTPAQSIRSVRPDLGFPQALDNLVMRCLEKERDLRPANAREVIREIERAEEEIRRLPVPLQPTPGIAPSPPVSPPASVPRPSTKPARKAGVMDRWAHGKRFWVGLAVMTLLPILIGPALESTRFSGHDGMLGLITGVMGGLGWFLVIRGNWGARAFAMFLLLNFVLFVGRRSVEIYKDYSWMRVTDVPATKNVYPIGELMQAHRCPVEVTGSRWAKEQGGHAIYLIALRNISSNATVTDWKADTLTFDDDRNLIHDSPPQDLTPTALRPGQTTSIQLTGPYIEAAHDAKLVFKQVDYAITTPAGAKQAGTWTNPHFQEDFEKAKQR